ncbi:MAG: class I SAM-dependent methyltransferase [Campylobacter sp.]|nr:class I SAM-dependent methyltransferase [Campylobacter sp.]
MINDEIKGTYDAVKYHSHAFVQASIDRLCAMARVYGLQTPLTNNAKVLEIGCAAGGNIISQAINYPNSSFVGIDLSGEQVKIGNEAIEQSGLKNIKLLQMDATKAPDELRGNEFDYIICHGVYSWVPDFVKKAIFEIGAKLLSPKGVMMVSFNVYPGWKYREPIRDFMRFASRGVNFEKDPENKLDLSLAALSFQSAMYRIMPGCKNIPKLKTISECNLNNINEIDSLKKTNRSYLLHEYLEIFNDPCYLVDFVADASDNGLEYIEDIALHYDYSEIANDTVLEFAKSYFKDRIAKDQMFDFLYSTQFRFALLTKEQNKNDLVFNYDEIDKNIKDLHISLATKYEHLRVLTKGLAMERLANALVDAYPNSLSIKEVSGLIDKGSLSEHIFDINSALNGGVNFHTKAQKVLKYEVGKTRVIASYKSFIKYLARDKNHILGFVTPQNKSANFCELDYEFLLLLDGKNTKSDIVKKLIEKCQKQGITLKEEKDGKIISYKTVAEQQAYFNKAVDIFAKGLEDYFMFEEF